MRVAPALIIINHALLYLQVLPSELPGLGGVGGFGSASAGGAAAAVAPCVMLPFRGVQRRPLYFRQQFYHRTAKRYGRHAHQKKNKAGYTAQDAPSTRLKITGDGRTDGPTDGRTHPLIEMRRRI